MFKFNDEKLVKLQKLIDGLDITPILAAEYYRTSGVVEYWVSYCGKEIYFSENLGFTFGSEYTYFFEIGCNRLFWEMSTHYLYPRIVNLSSTLYLNPNEFRLIHPNDIHKIRPRELHKFETFSVRTIGTYYKKPPIDNDSHVAVLCISVSLFIALCSKILEFL